MGTEYIYFGGDMMDILLRIRNILFRAFVLGYLLIIIIWLFSMMGWPYELMKSWFGIAEPQAKVFMLYAIGASKIANAMLFLIPALAIHWEYRSLKKRNR